MLEDNIMNKLYQLAHDEVVPISLVIELLTKCNVNCKHCYIPEHNSEGLTTKEVVNIIQQFRALGGLNLSLTGGEIFLRKDLFEIIEEARKLYLRVFLLTNGTLITKPIAKKLKELNIAELSISVYSMSPKEHDSITGIKDSLKKTLDGIEASKKYNIPIVIKTPLMEINKYAYKDVKKFCDNNGFKFLTSAVIFSKNNGDSTPKDLMINKDELKTISNDMKQFELSSLSQKNNFDEACGSLKYMLAIGSDGNIYPCNSLYYKLGNMRKNTLEDVWNSKKLKNIQNIMKEDLIECKNCLLKNKCNRCPGLALLEDNDIYGCSSTAKFIASLE